MHMQGAAMLASSDASASGYRESNRTRYIYLLAMYILINESNRTIHIIYLLAMYIIKNESNRTRYIIYLFAMYIINESNRTR